MKYIIEPILCFILGCIMFLFHVIAFLFLPFRFLWDPKKVIKRFNECLWLDKDGKVDWKATIKLGFFTRFLLF